MFSLFHDHSFGEGIFALFRDNQVVEVVYRKMQDSSQPCAVFEQLLDRHSLHLDDMAFLVCGVGPGSYTGIRSAAATMKAISFVSHRPIVATSSLLLLAPEERGTYLIAADGGIGGVFVQEISIGEDGCRASSPEVLTVEDFLKKQVSEGAIVVRSRDWLTNKGLDASLVCREVSPHAAIIAKIAFQDFEADRHYTASSLPLLYLRKTQAEIDQQKALRVVFSKAE